jgi:hypothetical protein
MEPLGNEPVMVLASNAGDAVYFHRHNARTTKCAECGAKLTPGRGVKRQMRNAPGSGYLCHLCAGAQILSFAKFSNDIPNAYSFSPLAAMLLPFDGTRSVYALPSAELAQAWIDHGVIGLRFAAETLREQARTQFLAARQIPFANEKIYSAEQVLA